MTFSSLRVSTGSVGGPCSAPAEWSVSGPFQPADVYLPPPALHSGVMGQIPNLDESLLLLKEK